MSGEIMAGRERKYTPRARTSRPIGEPRTSNAPPGQPLEPPFPKDGLWFIAEPLAHRLHEKSALGKRVKGGILLTPEEVMFCHWYRHVPLPEGPVWFEKQLAENENVAKRIIALDVLRNGGELVVPVVHLQERFPSLPERTWAIRWERHEAMKFAPARTPERFKARKRPRSSTFHGNLDFSKFRLHDADPLLHSIFGCANSFFDLTTPFESQKPRKLVKNTEKPNEFTDSEHFCVIWVA